MVVAVRELVDANIRERMAELFHSVAKPALASQPEVRGEKWAASSF